MKSTKNLFLTVLAMSALSAVAWAQTSDAQAALSSSPQSSDSAATTTASPADADLRSEVEELKQLVRAQQKRIDALETERPNSASITTAGLAATTSTDKPQASAAAGPAPDSSTAVNRQTSAFGQQAGSSPERIRN